MSARNGAMNRDAAMRRVMKAIALRSDGVSLPYTAEDGTHPLVVALPSDNLSAVVANVRSSGGHANVAVAFASHFSFVIMDSENPSISGPEMEVNEDLSMGMFLIKIRQHPNGRSRFRFANAAVDMPAMPQELAYS